MNTDNEEEKKSQDEKDFEKSIQEQIREYEQNPSVLLNGAEFLELLSGNEKILEQKQDPSVTQVPQKPFNEEMKDQLEKQLRLKFEMLKQLQKGKDQDRER